MLSGKQALCMDMTVLERQQARLKWLQQQQQQEHHSYLNHNGCFDQPCLVQQFQDFFMFKPEMYNLGHSDSRTSYNSLSLAGLELVGNNKIGIVQAEVVTSLEIDHCLSRTSSFQNGAIETERMEKDVVMVAGDREDIALMDRMQSDHKRGSLNKRKSEFVAAEACNDKRIKGESEVDSKVKEKSSTEISADSSKGIQKKPDYIHVRARRGQATDSHSLAERARREKISKKMKCLQDLVPGCNKITGRAGMLDEIINYVQSLQRQVEFLSMKLAALNPRLESSTDNFSIKEFPAYAAISSAMAHLPAHLQMTNLVQQEGSEEDDAAAAAALSNHPQTAPERTTSSSSFIPAQCLDSSCFPQLQSFWDSDIQNFHNVGFYQGLIN